MPHLHPARPTSNPRLPIPNSLGTLYSGDSLLFLEHSANLRCVCSSLLLCSVTSPGVDGLLEAPAFIRRCS